MLYHVARGPEIYKHDNGLGKQWPKTQCKVDFTVEAPKEACEYSRIKITKEAYEMWIDF